MKALLICHLLLKTLSAANALPKTASYLHTTLYPTEDIDLEDPLQLSYKDLREHCTPGTEKVALLLDKPLSGPLELLTNFRMHKDLSMWLYDDFKLQQPRSILKLSGIVDPFDNSSIQVLPGPITQVSMTNNIISPYVDYLTYLKRNSLLGKHLALVYRCTSDFDHTELENERFDPPYYADVPHEENIEDDQALHIIASKKFISISLSDEQSHITRIKAELDRGFVYQLALHQESGPFSRMLEPVVGVQYGSLSEKPVYPEQSKDGHFNLHVPHWAEKSMVDTFITIFHVPEQKYSYTIQRYWAGSLALIIRRNIELFVWLIVSFTIAKTPLIMISSAALNLASLTIQTSISLLESIMVVLSALFIANTILWIVSGVLGLLDSHILSSKRAALSSGSRIIPIAVLGAGIFFKTVGLLPFTLGMTLIITRTLFSSGAAPRTRASSLILQLLALAMYITVRIADIMAAVQYHIPVQPSFELNTLWVWGLIIWSQLIRKSAADRSSEWLRIPSQLALLAFYLPALPLAQIVPAFCLHLTINFILLIVPMDISRK